LSWAVGLSIRGTGGGAGKEEEEKEEGSGGGARRAWVPLRYICLVAFPEGPYSG
jgi:hypothetical protein